MAWWRTSVIYQIYPRSFKDSNADGIGDIRGITSRMDYLSNLGIGAIWLSPIYPSPMKDFGYDVSDYCAIDNQFGTMEDFDEMVTEAHQRDIRVILDLIPNHTSNQHKWFKRSEARDSQYTDYYVWHDGKVDEEGNRQPPNNWISLFNKPAWTRSEKREQFYLHQFLSEQPDLNYDNPLVHQEMCDVFHYWLETGVDGFRLDAIAFLYERNYNEDEPTNPEEDKHPEGHYDRLLHPNTRMLEGVYDVVNDWAQLCRKYGEKNGRQIALITEQYEPMEKITPFFNKCSIDLPFNFNLIGLDSTSTPPQIKEKIDDWLRGVPVGGWSNWVLCNHDNPRLASSMGSEMVDAMNLVLLTLPGTPTVYYGQELGLKDVKVTWEETQDTFGLLHGKIDYKKYSRDPCRGPMLWNSSPNAGFTFSKVKPWLPIGEQASTHNVQVQLGAQTSNLQFFRSIMSLRTGPAFSTGDFAWVNVTDEVIAYRRGVGEEWYIIVVVFRDIRDTTLQEMTSDDITISDTHTVLSSRDGSSTDWKRGDVILLKLKPPRS